MKMLAIIARIVTSVFIVTTCAAAKSYRDYSYQVIDDAEKLSRKLARETAKLSR